MKMLFLFCGDWSDITQSFVKTAYELKLVLNFDWGEWPEGKAMLQNKSQDFDNLDLATLCKLITTIIRADRFNDGYLISRFENGTILSRTSLSYLKVGMAML